MLMDSRGTRLKHGGSGPWFPKKRTTVTAPKRIRRTPVKFLLGTGAKVPLGQFKIYDFAPAESRCVI